MGCKAAAADTVMETTTNFVGWPVLVPVTFTLYLPAGVEDVVETVRVEVPKVAVLVKEILAVLRVAVGRLVTVAFETVVARATVPVKPRTLVTLMVDVPDEPAAIAKELGRAPTANVAALAKKPVWTVSRLGVAPKRLKRTQLGGALLSAVLSHVPVAVSWT